MSNKVTIKVSGLLNDVNNLVNYLPLEMVDYMSEAYTNSESPNSVHRFIKVDAKRLNELVALKKEGAK